uniref:WAT1-related protein n=1 Tax=Fagus sylvatica TaxID=28930 RepID=A0A2N9ITJ4_FAGSY
MGNNTLPFVGMVLVILAQASNLVVSKAALTKGMNKYIMTVYSNALASLILLPYAFIFHRSEHPPLTFSILCGIFLLAMFNCSAQIFGYVGIDYNSPTLSTAILQLIPAFTFILPIIFRWAHGGLFLAVNSFLCSLWYVFQAWLLKKYPEVLIMVFYQWFFGAIQSALFSLIVVNDPSAWRLKLDIGLFAILYSAIVATVLRDILCTWCVWKAGAFYCAMFKPLGIIFAVVLSVIFSGDVLNLGSLVGAIIIVTGFYAVMWGTAKEDKMGGDAGVESLDSSSQNVPLLQNKIQEKQNYPI